MSTVSKQTCWFSQEMEPSFIPVPEDHAPSADSPDHTKNNGMCNQADIKRSAASLSGLLICTCGHCVALQGMTAKHILDARPAG